MRLRAQACNAANALCACGSGYYGYGPAYYAVLPPAPMYGALPAYYAYAAPIYSACPGILRQLRVWRILWRWRVQIWRGQGRCTPWILWLQCQSWCRRHLPNRNTRRAAFVMVRCLGRKSATPRSPMLN